MTNPKESTIDLQPGRSEPKRILIVDDDRDLAESLHELLEDSGYETKVANSIPTAEKAINTFAAQIALIDIRIGRDNGVDLIDLLKAVRPDIICIMITGYTAIETAISALRKGAYDYLSKPLHPEELLSTLDRCFDKILMHRKNAQMKALLLDEQEKAMITLECIGDGVITTDAAGLVEYMNPVAETITGWKLLYAKGKPISEIFVLRNEIGLSVVDNPVLQCLQHGRTLVLPSGCFLVNKEGSNVPIEDSAAPLKDHAGNLIGAVLVFHDVTNARLLENQINYQSSHDALTGLINRYEFERQLKMLIDDALATNNAHCILYLDLDQFKLINDTCGHSAGDALLRQVTLIFTQILQPQDILSRLSGDEFGVLCPDSTPSQAIQKANALIDALLKFRFSWLGTSYQIGASIGMVPITRESGALAEIMSIADTACHLAKEEGRNRLYVYTKNDQALSHRHGEMRWVAQINDAMEQNRIILFQQPIQQIQGTDSSLSFEILVRMEDKEGKLIFPDSFIFPAERYNLMGRLDQHIVHSTFQWLVAHPAILQRVSHCGINLSGQTIGDENFFHFLEDELEKTGIPADKICFEITETAAISHLGNALSLIKAARKRGCRFALDDFGSGLSSFAYLTDLPVDLLKIDGLFVRDIHKNKVHYTMVKSMHEIAHVMGMQTVAEYVENDEILAVLKEIGIDYAQGYGIGKPERLELLTKA